MPPFLEPRLEMPMQGIALQMMDEICQGRILAAGAVAGARMPRAVEATAHHDAGVGFCP